MSASQNPLWLPEGSVRALLAMALVAAFIAGYVEKDIVLIVLGVYFVGRTAASNGG